jgi:hypothetical protein
MKTSVAVQIVLQRASIDAETQQRIRELVRECKKVVTYLLWGWINILGALSLFGFLYWFFSQKSMIDDSRETWADLCENFLVTQGNLTGVNCNRMWQNDFDLTGQVEPCWCNFAFMLIGILVGFAVLMYGATTDAVALPFVFIILGSLALYYTMHPEEFDDSDDSSNIDDDSSSASTTTNKTPV